MSDEELIDPDNYPFSVSPDPNLLYKTAGVKLALHKIRYTIKLRQGLTCILGPVGCGKSTVVRHLFAGYDARDDVEVRFMPTPNFSTEFAFLRGVCLEFGLGVKKAMLDQENVLKVYLAEQMIAGRSVVLFIDEAQRLSNKQLEVVRAMLNYETNDRKLLQLVLSGQMELHDRLLRDVNEAIRSRIVMPCLLNLLTLDEMQEMIEFRCSQLEFPCPFAPDAYERIYNLTGGVPREVLKSCQSAYNYMVLVGAERITGDMVDAAHREGTLMRKAANGGEPTA